MKNKYDFTMLYEFILLVAIIVIVALLVFQINQDARDDITDSDRTTSSVVNESISRPTTAGITFGSAYRDGSCGAITVVYNGTVAPKTIVSGNYTQTGCVIVNATDVSSTSSTWLISYPVDYAVDTLRYNATSDNDTAVAKIPKSLKLLATAIIFGVILFVILRVIPMRKGNELSQ